MTKDNNPFTRWVDEIAIWNHPLSSAEIAHQFQAAQASGEESPMNLLRN